MKWKSFYFYACLLKIAINNIFYKKIKYYYKFTKLKNYY